MLAADLEGTRYAWERQRSANEAAEAAKVQTVEYTRQLSVLILDRMENKINLEMQHSEETIARLEKDLFVHA